MARRGTKGRRYRPLTPAEAKRFARLAKALLRAGYPVEYVVAACDCDDELELRRLIAHAQQGEECIEPRRLTGLKFLSRNYQPEEDPCPPIP